MAIMPLMGRTPPPMQLEQTTSISEQITPVGEQTATVHHPLDVCSYIRTANRVIHTTCNYIGRMVTYYCDTYLPHPINIVALTAAKIFPFLLLQTIFPTSGYIASLAIIFTYITLTQTVDHPQESPLSIAASGVQSLVASRSLISASQNLFDFVKTKNVSSLILTSIELLCASVLFIESGVVNKILRK